MDLSTLLGIVARQWLASLVALAVTATTIWGVWASASPTYEAEAKVLLLPPSQTVDSTAINPYSQFGRNAEVLAEVLAVAENGNQDLRDELAENNLAVDVAITKQEGSAPIINILATDDRSASAAVNAVRLVINDIRRELDERQAAARTPDGQEFTLEELVRDNRARQLFSSRDRLAVAVAVVGLVATIAVALVAEALEQSMRQRRNRREWVAAPPDRRAERSSEPANGSSTGSPSRVGAGSR